MGRAGGIRPRVLRSLGSSQPISTGVSRTRVTVGDSASVGIRPVITPGPTLAGDRAEPNRRSPECGVSSTAQRRHFPASPGLTVGRQHDSIQRAESRCKS